MELDKKTIGNRIKFERKNIGLTQEELAIKLGLNNKSSISQYEKGDAIPSDDIKIQMCNLFGCSMDYLMGITSYKNPKRILEDRLYELNVNEAELKFIKEIFKRNNPIDISLYYMKELADKSPENKRELKILETVLGVTTEYFPEIDDTVGNNEEENKLNVLIENNIFKIKELVNSLDESNIIPNYNPSKELTVQDINNLTVAEVNDLLVGQLTTLDVSGLDKKDIEEIQEQIDYKRWKKQNSNEKNTESKDA